MYQVAAALLKDPADKTRLSLLFGNLTVDDILIKDELDALQAAHPERFRVYYVLNDPPPGWSGGSGFITRDMLQERLPPPGPRVSVLSCGPRPMLEAMKAHLDGLGHPESMQFQF
jgi:cytochrome-b5 reductase